MRDLEQEHEKLPSTMSLKKSIDMDPGFSFSGDTKTLSCGSEKGNNTLGTQPHSYLVSFQMQLYQIRRKTSPWHLHDM